MIRTAELGADDRIATGPGWREAQQGGLAGNHVLLEPELRHPEGVDHVVGAHQQRHRLAEGHVQLTAGDAGIGVVEDEGELHGRDLDRQGRGRVRIGAQGRADAGPGAAVGRFAVHGMHAVVVERRHAAHALVDVVAVDADEQDHHRGDGGPENLQRQIALDCHTIAGVGRTAAKPHQAVDD